MAITDLTDTCWYFNDNLVNSNKYISNLNFTYGEAREVQCDYMRYWYDDAYSGTKFEYRRVNAADTFQVYRYASWQTPSQVGWHSEQYKTIYITGGSAATDTSVIAWIQQNATQVVDPKVYKNMIIHPYSSVGGTQYHIDLYPKTKASNLVDLTATPTELNYSHGVTSGIQDQFNNRELKGISNIIVGDGSKTSFTVNHNFKTRNVSIQVIDTTNYQTITAVTTSRPNINSVLVVFISAPAANSRYKVLISRVGDIDSYNITPILSNITADEFNPPIINEGSTVELLYTADVGYNLPDTVSVTGATSSWDAATGTLVLSDPTGDVTFTIERQA